MLTMHSRLYGRCQHGTGSSSSSWQQHKRLAPLQRQQRSAVASINTQMRLRPCVTAEAAGQPQQPAQGPGDASAVEASQQQQQQLQQFEQQQEQQQQAPAAYADESEAAAAVLRAASETTAADGAAEDPEWQQQQQQQMELEEQQQWQQQHQQWARTSRNVYLLMALGLTAAGALVLLGAGPLAAAGLRLGIGLQVQQAAVLVGCVGAAVLRAASLAWFLAEGAALGELGSWRYQRINLGLAAAAAAAAVAALTAGWAGAAPWLVLLLLGGCGATTTVCASLAVKQACHQGFYFASALGYGDVFQGVGATGLYLLYNVTCLSGALMMGLAVMGLLLGLAAVSGSAVLPVLPWLAAGSSGVAAATLLHKLLGVGLLLMALQAWALTEYAANGREIEPELAVKLLYVRTAEEHATATGQLGPAPVHVPLRRFDLLHLGFIAAAVGQGLWLAQAAAPGPGMGLLNLSDPLWGSLFWSVGGTVLYLGVLVGQTDFSDLWVAGLRLWDWAGGIVALGAGVLYVDWLWLSQVDRSR